MRYLRDYERHASGHCSRKPTAARAGITTSTVSRLETGLQAARMSTVRRFPSAAVNVDLRRLLTGSGRPQIGGEETGQAA
jgi:predicted transcriptional regulator